MQLHVRRALVDGADLRIAIELFHRVVAGVAVTAEQLHTQRGNPLCHLRGEELGHCALTGDVLPRVLHSCGVVHYEACGFELRGGLRELELNSPEPGKGSSELLALLQASARGVQSTGANSSHLRAESPASLLERLERQ